MVTRLRSNTTQLRLPLDDQLSWDIFNSYAENREDDEDPGLSSHWTLTAASEDGRYPFQHNELLAIPSTGYPADDFYSAEPRSRFSPIDDTPTLILKLQRRGKNDTDGGATSDGRSDDEGLRAILSAAHVRASKKSKRAFGKILSHLTSRHEDDENNEKENGRFRIKSAVGDADRDTDSAGHGYFHFVASSPHPRQLKLRRTKSERERSERERARPNISRLQISSPLVILSPNVPSPPPLGRATTFVRRTKALPLRPSPIPSI